MIFDQNIIFYGKIIDGEIMDGILKIQFSKGKSKLEVHKIFKEYD